MGIEFFLAATFFHSSFVALVFAVFDFVAVARAFECAGDEVTLRGNCLISTGVVFDALSRALTCSFYCDRDHLAVLFNYFLRALVRYFLGDVSEARVQIFPWFLAALLLNRSFFTRIFACLRQRFVAGAWDSDLLLLAFCVKRFFGAGDVDNFFYVSKASLVNNFFNLATFFVTDSFGAGVELLAISRYLTGGVHFNWDEFAYLGFDILSALELTVNGDFAGAFVGYDNVYFLTNLSKLARTFFQSAFSLADSTVISEFLHVWDFVAS